MVSSWTNEIPGWVTLRCEVRFGPQRPPDGSEPFMVSRLPDSAEGVGPSRPLLEQYEELRQPRGGPQILHQVRPYSRRRPP